MAFLIFLLDIIYRSLTEIIGFFPVNRNTAIATIVIFSITGGIVIIPSSALLVFKYIEKSCIATIAWIIQLVLAGLYFYGKNINGIMIQYGKDLGCDEACQRTNQFVALFCLVLAIVLLTYLIPELHKYIEKNSNEVHHTHWHYFFGVILIFVNANAIYATISLIPVNIQCTKHAAALSSIFLGIVTFYGWIRIWMEFWTDDDSTDDDSFDHPCFSDCIFNCFTYFSMLVALPFYLLCDNQLPLEYTSCNILLSSNATFEGSIELESISTANHIVRLVGMLFTGVVVLLALFLFWRNHRQTKSRILQRD